MLKYWIRDENSKVGENIFDNVFEVDIEDDQQVEFEKQYPQAELVGDDHPETYESIMASDRLPWEKHNALVRLGLKEGFILGDPMETMYDSRLYS